jgi:RNA polymerase sigma factor (sigma-70 family)
MVDPVALINNYSREICALAWRLARRWRLDSDDVRQDLILVLLLYGKQYDPCRGGVTLWLTWRWKNLQRQRRPMQVVSDDWLDTMLIDDKNPASIAADKDELAAMCNAVDQLPSFEREVIQFNYGLQQRGRKSVQEIANATGFSSQWVSRRREAGIQLLRRILATA